MATGWRAVLLAALLALAACLSFIVVEAGRTETDGHEVFPLSNYGWQPPSFCRGKDCPEFEVKETRDDVELRHYKRAHWISTNVSNAKWSDAYDEGYKRLQKYISGDNKDGANLPQTNPSFTLIYVADAKAHTLQSTYTIEYFIPWELQEKPPAPNSTELAVTPVEEQEVWVVSFGGYATEEVVINRGFEFIDNLTRDGKDVHTEFIGVALYDQPARLVNRHNELWLWSKAKPSSEAVEQSAVEMIKQLFSAMVKRIGGHGA